MEIDDAPIFRYIYREFQPKRHLEFGTWEGSGALYCLEESKATVWSINLLHGEQKRDGEWAYGDNLSALMSKGTRFEQGKPIQGFNTEKPSKFLSLEWLRGKKRTILNKLERIQAPLPSWAENSAERLWYQTDSLGFIGRFIHQSGLGNRFCQIYCDSLEWDITNYPKGFFDTILIDGGHTEEVVISDTKKAIQLVRSGGIVMWHDFCPLPEINNKILVVRNVVKAIQDNLNWIKPEFSDLFWIQPSFILIGIKK